MLDLTEKIKILAIKRNTTAAQIAARSGQSSTNLYNKMARNDFKTSELLRIAEAVGCSVEINFILPNGEKI